MADAAVPARVDLTNFDVAAMLRCGNLVRRAASAARSLEAAADRIVRVLHDACVDPGTGARALKLVRFYKTHDYGRLESRQQEFARSLMNGQDARPTMKTLALVATAGDAPGWNSRYDSKGHVAIPLPSPDIVRQAPMVSQLIEQFGLDLDAVIQPTPEIIQDLQGKSYNVFHVEEARGSPYIPAQTDFVIPHGIRSVVGFGGLLRSGNLFALILFAGVPITASAAARFRSIALDVKSGIFWYDDTTIWSTPT